jgi:hypothetical protein
MSRISLDEGEVLLLLVNKRLEKLACDVGNYTSIPIFLNLRFSILLQDEKFSYL